METPTVGQIINWIIHDFENAWRGIYKERIGEPTKQFGAGNYLLSLQAMILLEVACRSLRLLNNDCLDGASYRLALQQFAENLKSRDPRYFIRFPGKCGKLNHKMNGFQLPTIGRFPERQLLVTLFDLIRNGHAHAYETFQVSLGRKKNRFLLIGLTGATGNASLEVPTAHDRFGTHLVLPARKEQDVVVQVRTDILYLDIRDSVRSLGLDKSDRLYLTSQHSRSYSCSPGSIAKRFEKITQMHLSSLA